MVFVDVGLGVLVEGLEVARAECAEAAGVDAGRRVEVGGFRVLLESDGGGGLVATDVAFGYLLHGNESSIVIHYSMSSLDQGNNYINKITKSIALMSANFSS